MTNDMRNQLVEKLATEALNHNRGFFEVNEAVKDVMAILIATLNELELD